MSKREFLKSALNYFFIIVTLVNVATYVLGMTFLPETRFGYEAFLSPLIYGACSMIPYCIMYSRKELTVRQYLFREVLQLISIEIILVFLAFGPGSPERHNYPLIASFCGSVLIIYILVCLFSWLFNIQSARKLTQELEQYQTSMNKQNKK